MSCLNEGRSRDNSRTTLFLQTQRTYNYFVLVSVAENKCKCEVMECNSCCRYLLIFHLSITFIDNSIVR